MDQCDQACCCRHCTPDDTMDSCHKVLSSALTALLSRKRLKSDAVRHVKEVTGGVIPISLQPPSELPFELLAPLRQTLDIPPGSNQHRSRDQKHVIQVDVGDGRLRVLFAEPIHHGPSGDTEEPGSKLGSVAQLRDPPDHSYPDILKDASSRLVVAHESPNERPEWRMPASDQILERGRFTQLAPYSQEFVGGGVVFGCPHKRLYRCSRRNGQKVHGNLSFPPRIR